MQTPTASRIANRTAQTAQTIQENNAMNTPINTIPTAVEAYQAYAQKIQQAQPARVARPRGYDQMGRKHTIFEVVMYKLYGNEYSALELTRYAINCHRKAEATNNPRLRAYAMQLSFKARRRVMDAIDDMRFIIEDCGGMIPNWEFMSAEAGLVRQGKSYVRSAHALPLYSDTSMHLEDLIVELIDIADQYGDRELSFDDIKPPANNLPVAASNVNVPQSE